MKTKNTGLIISGIFLILAGLAACFTAVLDFIARLGSVASSAMLALATCALVFIWAILNISAGFTSIAGRKKAKKLKKCFVLEIISIILFIIQCLACAVNGVLVIHLLIYAVCGFLFPCIGLFICRSKM